DDNVACTENDKCDASGNCQFGTPNPGLCTPKYPCAAYTCKPIVGCELSYVNITPVCRLAAGPCDVQETCVSGVPDCPADKFSGPEKTCQPAACSADFSVAKPRITCDGIGAVCPPGTDSACSPYTCEPGGSPGMETADCHTTCTTSDQCLPDFYCS